MALALGVSIEITQGQLARALVCAAIAVALIVLLRKGVDRLPMAGLGLTGLGKSVRSFALGVAVTGGSAAAMFALGTALGWLRWSAADWPVLLRFLALNLVIAFLFEALPEELTMRGYVYRSLNAGLRRWTAALLTTVLFLIVPAAATVVQAVAAALLGNRPVIPSIAPGGQDPVEYLVLLAFFGFALVVARIATGSLWTNIALHLTFLSANRITVAGESYDSGLSTQTTTPDALLLIPLYLLLSAAIFVALARLRGRRMGWRERETEGAV